ncbi:beta-galactosidase [Verrucomicrobia bacterium LW23]|nr:beta-galactosidase [Verrucomicrobia bacterium LW23]
MPTSSSVQDQSPTHRIAETPVPRPEYPRPQCVRTDWLCLNGEWQFEIDQGDSGEERGLIHRELTQRITVPFCPESRLSGIGNTDFLNAVWYRRTVNLPREWAGRDVLLHFQAVDYDATVWANGVEAGHHRGGFTPFSCNLRGIARPGETVTIVVRARDNAKDPQPRGKQSQKFGNHGCLYTRTTGIWQTVWMEPVPETALCRPKLTPDVTQGVIRLEQPLSKRTPGLFLRATLRDDQGAISTVHLPAESDFCPTVNFAIPQNRRRLWRPEDPFLYDIEVELEDRDGTALDRISTYAGLRSVTIHGAAVKINGATVFQRLVLDQGWYPDGLMTAPTDEALRHDIVLSMSVGFNGARLHQKVFEERFLYHADRLGYLVWGEFPDWGSAHYGAPDNHQQPTASYIGEWLEALARDYSHPSIIGWCPLNETHQTMQSRRTVLDDVTRAMFYATKAMDQTRPVLDASGYSHRVPETDIYDAHDYEQNPARFRERHDGLGQGKPYINTGEPTSWGYPAHTRWSVPYQGQPYFVSEFGGIWWNAHVKPGEDSWGYGDRPRTIEEFYARFEGLCAALLDNPHMFGYCYTQLTDVFQEQNGLFGFNRAVKFDAARLRAAQIRLAAIELHSEENTQVSVERTNAPACQEPSASFGPSGCASSTQVTETHA